MNCTTAVGSYFAEEGREFASIKKEHHEASDHFTIQGDQVEFTLLLEATGARISVLQSPSEQ